MAPARRRARACALLVLVASLLAARVEPRPFARVPSTGGALPAAGDGGGAAPAPPQPSPAYVRARQGDSEVTSWEVFRNVFVPVFGLAASFAFYKMCFLSSAPAAAKRARVPGPPAEPRVSVLVVNPGEGSYRLAVAIISPDNDNAGVALPGQLVHAEAGASAARGEGPATHPT